MDPKALPGTLTQLDPHNPLISAATGSPVPAPQSGVQQDTANAPQAGIDTMGNPLNRPPIPGGASLGAILGLKGQIPVVNQQPRSAYATKVGDNVATALQQAPQVAAQPGGIMRTIVGAGLQALSGVQSAIGDAAAATAPVPAGGGALTGVLRTLQARNQRLTNEKQQQFENQEKTRVDDANIAHAQMATLVAQQNLRLAGNEAKQKALESDDAMRTDLDAANVPAVASGLTGDQLTKWYQDNPQQRGKITAVVDHLDHTFDKEGNEFLQPVFKLYDMGTSVPVGEQSAGLINKYAPQGQELKPGTDVPFATYVNIMKQAKLAQSQDLNRQKVIADTAKNQADADKWNQEVTDKKNHQQLAKDIAPTMLHYGQDPNEALEALKKLNTPEAADMARKINEYYGTGVINELRKQAETERHNRTEEQLKQQEITQKKELENGNYEGIAEDLVDLTGAPNLLSKRGKEFQPTLNAANRISLEKYGEKYDWAKASTDYDYSKNVQTQNTLKYLNSLVGEDDKSGNLKALTDASKGITRTEFPALNDVAAWARLQTGDPKIAAYKATVTEVADQVAKILQGGGSGAGTSDAKLHQAQDLFATGFTKDQIDGIAQALQPLLGNRKKEMIGTNKYLLKDYGQNYAPKGALDPNQQGQAANGRRVWQTKDGKIKDSTGLIYDPQTGRPI